MKIKIGKHEIKVQKGDYIQTKDKENYKIYGGDMRILLVDDNIHYCCMKLPKTTFQKIPKSDLIKNRNTGDKQRWTFR